MVRDISPQSRYTGLEAVCISQLARIFKSKVAEEMTKDAGFSKDIKITQLFSPESRLICCLFNIKKSDLVRYVSKWASSIEFIRFTKSYHDTATLTIHINHISASRHQVKTATRCLHAWKRGDRFSHPPPPSLINKVGR